MCIAEKVDQTRRTETFVFFCSRAADSNSKSDGYFLKHPNKCLASQQMFGSSYLSRSLFKKKNFRTSISWNLWGVRIANATLKWSRLHCEWRPLLPAETSQTLLMCLAVGNKWNQVPHYGIYLARVSKIR